MLFIYDIIELFLRLSIIILYSVSVQYLVGMLVCESEENRRKLAWLVPGYILLAWFFCVVFQVGFCTVFGEDVGL
jgi:hypothetical protein